MHLLIPGRHHLLTRFQFDYLSRILNPDTTVPDIQGDLYAGGEEIEAVIFAVTSANHAGTKRNPLPFHLRAMAIQAFAQDLPAETFVYGIDDVGQIENFDQYTIKTIAHSSNYRFELTPENTLVICSTPVLEMYLRRGFRVLPAELNDHRQQTYCQRLPWEYVEAIAENKDWVDQPEIGGQVHSSSLNLWATYGLDEQVRSVLEDPIIGDDGDITESRDYNSYVRKMDDIADIKFRETSPFIKRGSIGDIGCAVGSWIKLAIQDGRFIESDFYGIEVARQLFDICQQRKHNGEFDSPSVFFAMKNAVTGLVFRPDSMDTIHTGSLTHEIESYGGRQDLLDFIVNRYDELKPGGVWINRDVVGPENGDAIVYMVLTHTDGSNNDPLAEFSDPEELSEHLDGLSTYSRFLRFTQDFRSDQSYELDYEISERGARKVVAVSYRDAAEFMLSKDYTTNWESEMHETFCYWNFTDWKSAVEQVGFRVRTESKAYQNPWILENRWIGKVELFQDKALEKKQKLPPTNMLLVAEKL